MKFGCTLVIDFFMEPALPDTVALCESFGGKEELIEFISQNFDAVEISGVYVDSPDPEIVLNAVAYCKQHGLYATIHGFLLDVVNAEDFFRPYQLLFSSGVQSEYNITVHPLQKKSDTEKLLRSICEYADATHYPVRITLENQRYQSEDSVDGLCKSVAEIVDNIHSDRLRLCFDFGHQLSGVRKYGEQRDPVDEKFFNLVKHTHIHSLFEGVTHYPLSHGETELDVNLEGLLRHGYDGVLNLELGPGLYVDRFDVKETLMESINILKTAAEASRQRLARDCK